MRTERNWSPKKIWINGVLDPKNHDLTAVRDIIDPIPVEGLDVFGIDYEGPLPIDVSDNIVLLDEVECPSLTWT